MKEKKLEYDGHATFAHTNDRTKPGANTICLFSRRNPYYMFYMPCRLGSVFELPYWKVSKQVVVNISNLHANGEVGLTLLFSVAV